jgi:DNA-binding transcriptional ArsR family regulator
MVEHVAELDGIYASLAHPVRREILVRLRDRDLRVTELAEPFPISLAAVSKHVGQLERGGLVARRVVGRDHWISLNAEGLRQAAGWLALYRSFWDRRLDALDALLRSDADG